MGSTYNNTTVAASDTPPLLIFLDTEFSDVEQPQLISIGLVAEDGKDYYVELVDGWSRNMCSEFVIETVCPLLEGGIRRKCRDVAARELAAWFSSFARPIRIVSDAPDYDWALMMKLLDNYVPENLLPRPLPFYSIDFPELESMLYEARQRSLEGKTQHHALVDAYALKSAWEIYVHNVHPALLESHLMS